MGTFDYLRRFTTALLSNIATLALSFILAIIVWSAANRANDPIITSTIEIPIAKQGLLSVDGETTLDEDSVRLTFQGPTSIAGPLLASDFTAFVDRSTLPLGESEATVQIVPNDPNLTIEILAQEPQTVVVNAIPIVTIEIPVKPSVRGEVARGYEMGGTVVDPNVILITGPENEVNRIASAEVSLFLESSRESVSVERVPTWLGPDQRPVALGNLETNVSEVTVSIEVKQTAGVKVVPIIATWQGEPPDGYRLLAIDVDPQTALITGSPSLLDQTQSIETEEIDISGAVESFDERVPLNLPEGVELDEVQPVILSVEIEPILTSDVIRKDVEVRALGEGLTMTLQTEEVTVFLFGPLPVLNSVTVDDVSVTLDLLDLGPGTHNIKPIVNVTATDVEFRSTQPEFITVEIQSLEELEEAELGGLTDGSDPPAADRPTEDENATNYPEPEN